MGIFAACAAVALIFVFAADILGLFKGAFFVDRRLLSLKAGTSSRGSAEAAREISCDVLVVGGGASGSVAAIAAAREGVRTCLIEETDWLGGMVTSAGVSSMDGHDWNYTGILKEFRDNVQAEYRGQADETRRCFAPFCFEPHVGARVLREMAEEEDNLTVYFNTRVEQALKQGNKITGAVARGVNNELLRFNAEVTVAADEWGDFLFLADAPFDLGLDGTSTEPDANQAHDCIQPITYVALVKDVGASAPPIPLPPPDYDPVRYQCFMPNRGCRRSTTQFVNWDFFKGYGQFPFDKIMVNVPSHSWGNDFAHTDPRYDRLEREQIVESAKNYTLGLIYFIQTTLGRSSYRLVTDEFGTADGLAKIPYGRESRRGRGVVRLTEHDILPDPAAGESRFWPDSIAVGDYFIDLHRCAAGSADIFKPVPPFQVPYRALIPEAMDGLIFAEKNISVSHIANGATRLQPIVMNIGQAAGTAAAMAASLNIEPRNLAVPQLQSKLVSAGQRINYYEDVREGDYFFGPVSLLSQRNVVRGYGRHIFGAERPVMRAEFAAMLFKTFGAPQETLRNGTFTFSDVRDSDWFSRYVYGLPAELGDFFQDSRFEPSAQITRGQAARWLVSAAGLRARTAQRRQPVSFDDLPGNYPYRAEVELLASLDILRGRGSYIRPNQQIRRSEAVTMIFRAANYE